jgi:CheY-like chemotaxis protein/anti-sigma regulatory factor (Ser/Thr protein kinase)
VAVPSDSPPRRITIVETPGDERATWQSSLQAAGWTVSCCASAPEAVKHLERAPADVLVSEIELHPAGALELLKLVKAVWPGTRVICTARQHELTHVLECLRGGAADYLRRPFEPSQLVSSVAEAVLATPDDDAIDIEMGEMGWIELRMPSSERSMKRLDKFFRLLYEPQVGPEALEEISLCFMEVVKNAIEWGHRFDISKRVLVSHMLFQDEIVFKVVDTGSGFDSGPKPERDDDLIAMETAREAAGKRPGGLGITMVRGLMDSVIYNKTGNMIVMSKKIYDAP